MLINELTDPECDACGDALDVLAEGFEAVAPLLCEQCLEALIEDEARPRDLPVAA